MKELFGVCSACTLLPVGLVAAFKAWRRVELAREATRFKAMAELLLAELPTTPLPAKLAGPPPREQAWGAGYYAGGHAGFRALAHKLLRVGVVRRACVLESSGESDGDGGWDGRLVYAFHGLDGRVEVHHSYSSVDAMHAGLSQGVGEPEPAFDLHGLVGDWIHVLIDPVSKKRLIYEALLLDKPPRRR